MNMDYCKRFAREAFNTGGILALGTGCLILYNQKYFPSIPGPVSLGIAAAGAAGAFGIARHITVAHDHTDGKNVRCLELLREVEERLPEIEEDLNLSEELRESCYRSMSMRERLEAWRRDPSLIEERIPFLERLLQKARETSSCARRKIARQLSSCMRNRQASYWMNHWEEDMGVADDEDEGQADAGYTKSEKQQTQQEQEDEKKKEQKKFLEMLRDIPEVLLKPENLRKEVSEGMLETVLEKLLKDVPEEVVSQLFAKEGLREERAKEVLWLETSEAVSETEIVKTMPSMGVVEVFLKEMVANVSIMQELAEDILEETNKDALGEKVAKRGTLLETVKNMLATELVKEIKEKASQNVPLKEVPEEMLQLWHQTKKALMEIMRNLLRGERERKEEEMQKLPVKLRKYFEMEEGKIQKKQIENPEIVSVGILQKNKEEEMNI